jgi:type I restriction enzyme S subunit
MERYAKYKDSGVEWIGEIPEGWNVCRLKYYVTINDESLPESTDEDSQIKYVDISSVKSGEGIISYQEVSFRNAPSRARRIVRHGDIIVSTVRTYLKSIAKIENPETNLIVSTGFAVIRPRKLNYRYVGHTFLSDHLIEEIISRSTGVSYPAINASEIGNITIPILADETQTTISNYLDRKTAEIDNLIAQKERLIELYEEEKAAIINQAVTKGIDPNAKLKDSGVDWLGEIPERWDTVALKRVCKFVQGQQVPLEDQSFLPFKNSKRFIRIENYTQNSPDFRFVDFGKSDVYEVDESEVVIVRYGASAGSVVKGIKGVIANNLFMVRLKNNELVNDFLFYFLKSMYRYFQLEMAGSAMPALTFAMIEYLCIPITPKKEQLLIVEFIESQTKRVDVKIAKTKRIIELQKEYRTALISEVVTGKIKVTEESTP